MNFFSNLLIAKQLSACIISARFLCSSRPNDFPSSVSLLEQILLFFYQVIIFLILNQWLSAVM